MAAVAVLLALVGTLMRLDDDQTVDTTPVTEVPVDTTPAEVPVLPESGPSGPDLDRGTVVHRMTGVPDELGVVGGPPRRRRGSSWTWSG